MGNWLASETIRWACNALIALMLFRAARKGFVTQYPIFYFYLAHVLVLSVVRFYTQRYLTSTWNDVYWYTEFISLAIGYCIIWEIYRLMLAEYPGTARLAQRVVWAIFVVVVAKVISDALSGPVWSPAATVEELARNFRSVQASLLIAALGLLVYYAIPIGGNLRGIILGYSFFIGIRIITLTLKPWLGAQFQTWAGFLPGMIYLLTLLIWCRLLWSYQPNPQPEIEIEIERDYELLAQRTARALARARSFIVGEAHS